MIIEMQKILYYTNTWDEVGMQLAHYLHHAVASVFVGVVAWLSVMIFLLLYLSLDSVLDPHYCGLRCENPPCTCAEMMLRLWNYHLIHSDDNVLCAYLYCYSTL